MGRPSQLDIEFTPLESGDRLRFEKEARYAGYRFVAGVDEAGRGPLAGPVVASAVILDPDASIDGLDDSKVLTPLQRDSLFERIRKTAVAVGVGVVQADRIDRINILRATLEGMRLAVERLSVKADFALIDGNQRAPLDIGQKVIVGGDALCPSISAASIVAKVVRDRLMAYYHTKFPLYNFLSNKGYATLEHRNAIARHGVCPIHRRTFQCVKEFVNVSGSPTCF